jgi:hypothetical protein
MPMLDRWDSFYVIVGSAAGALIGLQFVVMTLVAQRPPPRAAEASSAFATPTIIHFSIVLAPAAVLRAPWDSLTQATIACGLIGVAGFVYAALTGWRMGVQKAYAPDLEDWLFHALLPLVAYATLAISSFVALSYAHAALFAIGGATLLLLFVSIHNAWDAVAYHVLVNLGRKDPPEI